MSDFNDYSTNFADTGQQSGPYQMGAGGTYKPVQARPNKGMINSYTDPNAPLNSVIQALMKGYLRKQQQPGSYIPLTSEAPSNILNAFKPLDRYRNYGVPYTGMSTNALSNPYNTGGQSPSDGSFGGGGY